jgi:hypothetical protein
MNTQNFLIILNSTIKRDSRQKYIVIHTKSKYGDKLLKRPIRRTLSLSSRIFHAIQIFP